MSIDIARRTPESGVAAMLVAASLVALLGVAAIVVDGGQGFSERRQAQSAADFAALAALQFAVCESECSSNPLAEAVEEGTAEAQDRVHGNLPGRSLDWSNCRDAEKFPRWGDTECVSFTDNFDEARVVIPDDDVSTAFGRVVGRAFMTVSALAEVGQSIDDDMAPVIPYTLSGLGPNSCLFSNQAPQTVPPCNGPSNGNFGYLDIALFGNDDMGTPSTCTGGTPNDRAGLNTALGADHIMSTWTDHSVNDHSVCPNRSENVNELRVRTGSATTGTTKGLIDGVSGSLNGTPIPAATGRLQCDGGSMSCTTVRGKNLDNTPLWDYLASGCPETDTHAEMITCLESGNPTFSPALGSNPRFVAVPVFQDYPINGASNNYPIVRFAAVYLETIYQGCNANRCTTVFSPGEADGNLACPNPLEDTTVNCGHGANQGPDAIEGLTGFQIPLGALPTDIRDKFPGQGNPRALSLTR